MDNEVKQMFEFMIDRMDKRFDKLDERFDKVENRLEKVENRLENVENRLENVEHRLENLENEFSEFRFEMKEELKRIDAKIDLIYNKLTSDIEEIKNKPEPKFKIVRES